MIVDKSGYILTNNHVVEQATKIQVQLNGDTTKYTAPLAIMNLGQSQYQTYYNLIDAMVVIITLPIALIVLFAQRRIISGLTAGSFR